MTSKLKALIETAKNHTMTDDELRAQRESWVRGEKAMRDDPDEALMRPVWLDILTAEAQEMGLYDDLTNPMVKEPKE